MTRGFRLPGDNALAALQRSIRSRHREDDNLHRVEHASGANINTRAADAGPSGRARSDAAAFDQRSGPPARHPSPVTLRPAVSAAPIYPLVGLCRSAGLPEPVPEYQFHPQRRWRFDFAWPMHRIAIEIDGGIWSQGRHTRGSGFLRDLTKFNAATLLGWRVLKYAPDQLGDAIRDLRIMFAGDAA